MDDLPLARRDIIAERLAQGQPVAAAPLAVEFGVSEDAIRRDLRALAAEGRCRRVYGGALPLIPGASPITARIAEGAERKRPLARAAAGLIRRGEFLFIDCGSTNLALVDFLPDDMDLTVATNSVSVAAAILQRPEIKLILIGGTVDPMVGGAVDAAAMLAIGRMHFDRCILGACAISATHGICTVDHADAVFKQALLDVSATSVALVTNEKLGTRAAHQVVPMSGICLLYTSPSPRDRQKSRMPSSA